MIRVRNGKTLRRISRKILKASGGRNIIAMTAIAMTAMLFTAMLTMGGSVLETVQQDTFRQVGGISTGASSASPRTRRKSCARTGGFGKAAPG